MTNTIVEFNTQISSTVILHAYKYQDFVFSVIERGACYFISDAQTSQEKFNGKNKSFSSIQRVDSSKIRMIHDASLSQTIFELVFGAGLGDAVRYLLEICSILAVGDFNKRRVNSWERESGDQARARTADRSRAESRNPI